jgi:hypothetical protein
MKNFYPPKFLKAFNLFLLVVLITLFFQQVSAQTLYKTVAATQVNIQADLQYATEQNSDIKSEGSFVIKDGTIDDISSFKFILPNSQLKTLFADSVIGDKSISFVQTHVMVLPLMGMVHFVGMLEVGGDQSWADFQLAFAVNSDQSITFKGTKVLKLSDYMKQPFYNVSTTKPKDEVTLKMNFVLKNNLAVLTK